MIPRNQAWSRESGVASNLEAFLTSELMEQQTREGKGNTTTTKVVREAYQVEYGMQDAAAQPSSSGSVPLSSKGGLKRSECCKPDRVVLGV